MRVERTDHFCPHCGKQTVHVDRDDSGDYYVGTTHYCVTCHHALPDLDGGGGDLLRPNGIDDWALGKYLEIRVAAALPASTDAEMVRLEKLLAEATGAREERNKR